MAIRPVSTVNVDVSMLQFVRIDKSWIKLTETSLCHDYKVEELLDSFKVGQPLIYYYIFTKYGEASHS